MDIFALWTHEIDFDLEKKIMNCFNATFLQSKKDNYFKWKFRDNPFGDSLHIICTQDNEVIASRVFWRLDIDRIEAYQCVDTSVLPKHQRKGIFKESTLLALKILKNKLIYNYPNELSGPAYLKLGWKVIDNSESVKVNIMKLMIKSSPINDWSKEKLIWRFKENPESEYFSFDYKNNTFVFSKFKNNYFLLLFRTKERLNLSPIKPVICFSNDHSSFGIPIFSKLPYMYRGTPKHDYQTFLFDMA